MTPWYNRIPFSWYLFVSVLILVLAAFIEFFNGRIPIAASGVIKLWGAANSPDNSQQLIDWYSLSHIIHGIFFYWFFRTVSRKKWPIGLCLLLAIGVEAGWEVLENSSVIINRYRSETASLDYFGDSILNSMSDIIFCGIGFALAAYLPVWVTIALVIFMEVLAAYVIRDNLTLNIIMLIYPIKSIQHWQLGGQLGG